MITMTLVLPSLGMSDTIKSPPIIMAYYSSNYEYQDNYYTICKFIKVFNMFRYMYFVV